MCVVSMIIDSGLGQGKDWFKDDGNRKYFEQLLKKAREYDEEHNEPECEMDEKRKALQKIADELGVEIKFL